MGTFCKSLPFTMQSCLSARTPERRVFQSLCLTRARNDFSTSTQPAIRVRDSGLFTSKSRFAFPSKLSFLLPHHHNSSSLSFTLKRSFSSYPTFDLLKPLKMDSSNVEHQAKKRCLNNPDVDNAVPTLDLLALAHNQSKLLKSSPVNNGIFRIIVEGNIGSGKTTFLKIFAKNCSDQLDKPLIVPEPIDLWRDVGGENVFQLLGDDPQRWSFAFQSFVQLTMMRVCFDLFFVFVYLFLTTFVCLDSRNGSQAGSCKSHGTLTLLCSLLFCRKSSQ